MTDDTLRPLLAPLSPVEALTTALAQPRPDVLSVDALVDLWIAEQRSERTQAEYRAVMSDFRAWLSQVGLDLDAGDHHKLKQVAQVWSERRVSSVGKRYGAKPSVATQARRIAIVSSFYIFGMRSGLHEWKRDRRTGEVYYNEVVANPMRLMKRLRVERYAEAQPIPQSELIARLRKINRATVLGKRDYALLSVALVTGRRIAELQGMTRASLTFGRDRRVTVRFETKGGKVMRDRLGDKTSAALLDYLRVAYQTDDPAALPSDAPVWLTFSRATHWINARHGGQAQAMTTSGIRRVFDKWLQTSKAHVSRHSFGPLMEQAGASLTDIQARLGHASAKTTADYMNSLKSADNPFMDRLEALLGLE